MRRFAVALAMLLTVAGTSFAKTHREPYSIPCATLWTAVKDNLRNSGEYRILWLDSTEMGASFAVGGQGQGMRVDSVVLNAKGAGCEMILQMGWGGGGFTDDAGDFKKRVDAALAKPATQPAPTK